MRLKDKKIPKKHRKKINKKRVLLLCIVIAFTIIIVQFDNKKEPSNSKTYYEILENGVKLNTSEKLLQNKKFEQFKITNIKITRENALSTISISIENTGKEPNKGVPINIKFVDNHNKEINTVVAYIPELKSGETRDIDILSTEDISEAYNFKITRNE